MSTYLKTPAPLSSGEIGARTPAITVSLGSLRAGIDDLHDVIGNLEARLSPVVSPEECAKTACADKLHRCALEGEIDGCGIGVDAALQRLQSILNRLEI